MTPADAEQILCDNFADWVRDLNPEVSEIAPGHAVLTIPITPRLARIGGIISGQALSALADTAMVIACAAQMGEFRPIATTNLDMQFLRPGTGDHIRCMAEVTREGRALLFTRATMIAEPSGKPVATATATFFRP